ncbi:MAG: hypothetical protein ABI607_09340 [Betaproteobacteria bacterium]
MFDEFLEAAWNDHADHPQEVSDRLARSLHLIAAPEHVSPFVRVVTHVYGEHLGQWARGVDLLESMRSLPAFDGGPAAAGALTRSIATLRYCSGDIATLLPLCLEDRISVLATAASVFGGHNNTKQAIAVYGEALRLANAELPAGSPALRALAAGGNNLAAALEEKHDRDALETDGMVIAAQGALKYWKLAGTWLEEERAEYRLTRSLLQAGRAQEAVASAARCVAVCEQNCAPPIEVFVGHAVLALSCRAAGDAAQLAAARAQAVALFEKLPEDERQWAQSRLDELDA